ncbi:MAG: aminopeptidase [Nocardioidaceae bacterium]
MSTHSLAEGARRLVRCGGVQRGEEVLIITDDRMDPTVVEAFAQSIRDDGGELVIASMDARSGSGQEPPAQIAKAMRGAKLAIELTSQFIHHSIARQSAQRAGLRYLFIGDIDRDMLESPGAVYADFAEIAPRITRMSDEITQGSTMSITSPGGTDMTFDLVGRNGRALTGLADAPSQFGAPPCLEGGVIPKPGGSAGRVVVDAYCVGVGLIQEPITVLVEGGRAVSIEGGAEAKKLRDLVEGAGNDNAWNVSEVGIGFNDTALLIDNVTSAESIYGTAHIALGSTPADLDIEMISAGIHLDMVFHQPTITVDDRVAMRAGEFLLDYEPATSS